MRGAPLGSVGQELGLLADIGMVARDASICGLGQTAVTAVASALVESVAMRVLGVDGWAKGWPLGRFAARVGARWRGRGVAWPPSSRLSCTLLACWEAGHEGAWLILTDLEPQGGAALWYAWRSWIEQGFRDLKSDGWQLSKTRMTDPPRVGRWWAAAALATLWVIEAGTEAQRLEIPATQTHVGKDKAPVTSLFALGLAWLGEQLGRGVVRRLRRLPQPPWPTDEAEGESLKEQDWIAQHQTIPL